MERVLMKELIAWKESPRRKPLVLMGARQVGKTWLMKTFGQRCYAKTAYINFDHNERMQRVFAQDFDIDRLLMALNAETGISITSGDTLIILDEVQEAPLALSSLKYFCENAPGYHVIAAGSFSRNPKRVRAPLETVIAYRLCVLNRVITQAYSLYANHPHDYNSRS